MPKPGAAIYQSQADPATRAVIVPVFFWDSRSAPAGPGPDSMFATNCDRLEIFAGGIHLATATPDRRGSATWPTRPPSPTSPWAAAPSRTSGWTATSGRGWPPCCSCPPTPCRDRLRLIADDTTITADGSDATRVTFRATDAYGNHRPDVTGEVTLTLTGPAALIGQNPFAFGSYGGVGGSFVRSIPGKTGQVTVTARHATLGSASVRVTVATARSGRISLTDSPRRFVSSPSRQWHRAPNLQPPGSAGVTRPVL